MKYATPPGAGTNTGDVLEVSRRHVTVVCDDGTVVSGTTSSKALEVVAGDRVSFHERGGQIFVTDRAEPTRCLYRSYHGTIKRMGAHIDLLCIVTAPDQTLNPVVIDRMLVAATVHSIPAALIINKADLGAAPLTEAFSIYQQMNLPLITCSAQDGSGLEQVQLQLTAHTRRIIALCGVSGVGKSTLLNRLVPEARARTADVSARTGQGKQTTTQPRGFLYYPTPHERRIIIDLPGVQFFGLAHITAPQVEAAFEDFAPFRPHCRFVNCKHLREPACGVRTAVERSEIAPWRYQSYLQILEEVEAARPY